MDGLNRKVHKSKFLNSRSVERRIRVYGGIRAWAPTWWVPTAVPISTIGQLGLCSWWNFGWYGSNIRIFPHRLKNNAIAATHSTSTNITMSASSALTTGTPVQHSHALMFYCISWTRNLHCRLNQIRLN